jgi:hypothetical protein
MGVIATKVWRFHGEVGRAVFSCMTLLWLLPCPGNAQETQPGLPAQLAAMEKLHPFVGTWLGEGWFSIQGERFELVQGVTVSLELEGQVITTRDMILRRTEPPSAPRRATFGIWSYDEAARAYRFRSYYGSDFRDYDMRVPEPGLLIATGDTPGGLGRLTMDGRDGVWREKAERSQDGGKTWREIYAITMRRQQQPSAR